MQKKILAILLILSMLLTFAACGGGAGNGSHYYVKDLVVEAAESCEVNGYKYTLYSFSYKDVYPSQNKEFDENGMFGYVQVGEDVSLLIEECSFSDFAGFVESALYIKDATIN